MMHRVLFHSPWGDGTPVASYGVLLLVGFLLGTASACFWARMRGVSPLHVFDIGLLVIVVGVVGARALYVIEYWDVTFADRPWAEVFAVQHGGMVYYGGLIPATTIAIALLWWWGLDWRVFSDIIAPSLALGQAFGRLGCFCNGCCFGVRCAADHPLAVEFPPGCPCFGAQLTDHTIAPDALRSAPVFATQLVEAAYLFVVFGALTLMLWKRLIPVRGGVLLAFVGLNAIGRFAVEYYRDNPRHALGWTSAQFTAVGLGLGVGVVILICAWRSWRTAEMWERG